MLESNRQLQSETDDTGQQDAANHEAKTRLCLSCSEDFPSAWAGERVCKKCRSSTKWRQGYE